MNGTFLNYNVSMKSRISNEIRHLFYKKSSVSQCQTHTHSTPISNLPTYILDTHIYLKPTPLHRTPTPHKVPLTYPTCKHPTPLRCHTPIPIHPLPHPHPDPLQIPHLVKNPQLPSLHPHPESTYC
jgi:hypothetical protein